MISKQPKLKFLKARLPRDRDALAAFDRRVFRKTDCFESEVWDQLESYWMIVGGERAGCCAFERHTGFYEGAGEPPKARGTLYIVSTGILPRYRGTGLGDKFKRWQIAWARRHGFMRIVTNSRRSNRAIIRLNQKHGFEIMRITRRNYYSRPAEPAVVMELKLRAKASQRPNAPLADDREKRQKVRDF